MAVLALGYAPGTAAQDIDILLPGMECLNMLQSRAEIPLLVSIDGEWGMSMRFAEFPLWPRQMQLGTLRDEDLVYRMGRQSLQLRRGSTCHLRSDAFRRCPPCLRRWPFRRLRREMM